ncbi:MAG: ATP-binding protein [Actinomycetota bacterium]|nr:ATP-binding protein [Actinomycetota bacterium]
MTIEMLTLDALPGAIVVVDADRRIVGVGAAVTRLTGHRRTGLIGVEACAAFDPTDNEGRPLWRDGWDRSVVLGSVHRFAPQVVQVRTAGGSRMPVRVTGTYQRDEAGAPTGAVLCFERTEAAAATDRSIEIISTVSHELRSPLTSVKGYTSLLLHRWDRLRDEQKRMMLEAVHHDADRVTRLVTELLDISRLETGRLVLRRQLVDLAELASSVVDKVSMSYPDLDADVSFSAEVPRVFADPDKIEQVLTNLVENACKYASPLDVRIEGRVDGDEVSVAVHDRGEGISAEDLPQVFTRFFRRSDARPSGSGLGLWISRGLVQSHGGQLRAESQPPNGATFRFTLPLADPAVEVTTAGLLEPSPRQEL